MNKSKKQTSVLIRATSDADKKLLEDLRKETGESTYTRAIMKASKFYVDERKDMDGRIRKAEVEAYNWQKKYYELQSAVETFIKAQDKLKKLISE